MELTIYDIIKGPLVSDKAYKLNRTLNQLVLKVHPKANKPQIKDAIEKLFNVKVKQIRTMIRKESTLKATNKRYASTNRVLKRKVAYVTLAEGYTLNFFDQAATPTQEAVKKEH